MNKKLSQQIAAQRHASFSRRNFLRGLGACLTLPALESVMPAQALAAESAAAGKLATTTSGAPLRSAYIFFPNGAIPASWWPENAGADIAMSDTLKPLEESRKLIQICGGLDHQAAEGGPDGGGDHARGNGVFLTGTRLRKSATDIQAGISIDQVMANQVGHLTRMPSLEITCDNVRKSSGCDSGYSCAYQYNISWRSSTTPMTPENNPRLVFERLFGSGAPGERVANMKLRQKEQRSILDFVLDDARSMQRRLGAGDKEKLDQYLTSVREIERRIEQSERFGEIQDPEMPTPAGVPTSQMDYVNLMFDMMLLGFQSDSTRVATFVLGHDGDNRSFNEIGIPEGHHDLTHHQNDKPRMAKVQKIDQWYVEQFAKFLLKMQATKDLDGQTLLDNSMIVYGSGNADGNRHTHSNLPLVLAGGGGGSLAAGRYVQHGSQPMSNLFLSMADRMGVTGLDRFGDSTGRLANV
jgi:hypothetical protein